ncbi:MAG: SDR family oxidoreductase [Marinicaulis sp.]|nr:SDR family oxidoreductase [Marinicaulis sp.]NNE42488.1 SDR family oxidoreductase [Marinicaulis sp.]NNL90232.1 SDR family oxidoreductase [Marinicaulis sp.]
MYQSVLVTGASSGIGEATAIFLAHKGFRVFAAARRKEKLEPLSGLGAGRITPIAMDVTSEDSINEGVAEINKKGGPIYAVVNNAGVSVMGPIEQISLNDWRWQFETNVFGVANVIRATAPAMREAGKGRIINIGSMAGRIAAPFQGVYASSKHAIEGMSDSLRRELAPHGVKVIVIRPGFINTPFGEQEQDGLERFAADGEPYAEQVKIFKRWHAKGHPSAPPPSVVAEQVHRALTAENPSTRYTAPPKMMGALALRIFLPASLTDRIFERMNGLSEFRKKS